MIKVYDDNNYLHYSSDKNKMIFNGGEVNVTVGLNYNNYFRVEAVLRTAEDIIELYMVNNAIRIERPEAKVYLIMPYVPYARQNRVCNKGEALSIKAFAELVNQCNFAKVLTLDNHSDVATALIDRCFNYEVKDWFNPDVITELRNLPIEREMATRESVLISPDAGSLKKIYKLSKHYGGLEVIMASKHRDVATGDITGTEVHWGNLRDKNVIIVDDICDGGRTFIELAKVLKKRHAGRVDLIVTHGIFSKGLEVFEGLIDHIYTTNSFCELESDEFLTVIDCFGVMYV